jgi:hypothetical protein
MHDKLLVTDNVVLTGRFNLSRNAESNAENVLAIHSPALAKEYDLHHFSCENVHSKALIANLSLSEPDGLGNSSGERAPRGEGIGGAVKQRNMRPVGHSLDTHRGGAQHR